MKKITYLFILCVLSLWTMTSCNDENQIINEEGEKTESPVINTKVIDYIKDFAAKANEGSITTKAALDLEVTNINKKLILFL